MNPSDTKTPDSIRFICTIGPQNLDREALAELAHNGMGIARVNGSHGSLDDVRRMIQFLKENLTAGVEILLDLPGNKIRTDNIETPFDLVEGAEFVLEPENLTYPALHTLVSAGARISAADGLIQLEVLGVEEGRIRTRVLAGGKLANRKGINIRGIHAGLPFDFERDISLMNIAIETGIDYLGLSFVRSSEHVRRIKSQLVGTDIRVVAKVETAEAVSRLDHILADAHLIMIDRGDLEAEIGRENVPLTAKRVIRRARQVGTPVIVASQFLCSMLEKPIPLMAEVSDISNAVLDGADILMLSEETAIGRYPAECIATMSHVARSVEAHRRRDHHVVILSAGPSTGFGSLTTNKHKSMLDVGGTTIVRHQLENLRACGIPDERVTVVTGHNERQIEHYLRGEEFTGNFLYNPWYATTNILTSLWLARRPANLIVLYGDIIFDRGILADLLVAEGPAVLAIDRDSPLTPEDEKVQIENGLVVAGSKELDPKTCQGEFIGLARFDEPASAALFAEMDEVVKGGGLMDFLTVCFAPLARKGVALRALETVGRAWNDNDCLSDLDHSRDLVYPAIQEAQRAREAAQQAVRG